ncbi:MAG: DUF4167 domain-containing protein [Pseudomonadota bacterium]
MRNGQNNNKRMRNRNNNHNNNNNRRGQNPMTRVYDSNGPDVKIRGTAAHIAEKYLQLARDSQSSGDPVAAENYYQHAEHYFRLIAAAQEQFRQNQPQPQQQQPRLDQDGEDEESFSNFGAEPGFGLREPQPSYQSREQQPSYQPREHNRDRDRDPGLREQPREQSLREVRPQPVQQDSDAGDVDRLPSFITGAQPQQGNGTNGYEGNGHQGGDRFPPRRRRRPHGPRGEGRSAAQPSLSEDFSSGE